jgi:hypothetical protein
MMTFKRFLSEAPQRLSFKDFLLEIFDKHYPYKSNLDANQANIPNMHSYTFYDHMNKPFDVHIKHDDTNPHIGHIMFNDEDYDSENITGNSGTHSIGVLSTVKKIALDHAARHNIQQYRFTSSDHPDDKSRARLYKKLADKTTIDKYGNYTHIVNV